MRTGNIAVIDDWTKEVVCANQNADRIAVADVQSFTNWVESRGKRTRDWLANNVNHAFHDKKLREDYIKNDIRKRIYRRTI